MKDSMQIKVFSLRSFYLILLFAVPMVMQGQVINYYTDLNDSIHINVPGYVYERIEEDSLIEIEIAYYTDTIVIIGIIDRIEYDFNSLGYKVIYQFADVSYIIKPHLPNIYTPVSLLVGNMFDVDNPNLLSYKVYTVIFRENGLSITFTKKFLSN